MHANAHRIQVARFALAHLWFVAIVAILAPLVIPTVAMSSADSSVLWLDPTWFVAFLGAMATTWLLTDAQPLDKSWGLSPRQAAMVLTPMLMPALWIIHQKFGGGVQFGHVMAWELGALGAGAIGSAYAAAARHVDRCRLAADTVSDTVSVADDSHDDPAATPTPMPTPVTAAAAAADETTSDDAARDGNDAKAKDDTSAFVGHARVVAGMTMVSRFTGLGRDAALAAVFGLGGVADAFFIGFIAPNLFRRLFGEGALSSAFIPQYTRMLRENREAAKRFAAACFAVLALGLTVITLLGEAVLGAGLWAGVWAQESALAAALTMWMLPYMPLVCLVALAGGVLQVHRRFASTAAAPVLLNLAMIAAAVTAMVWPTSAREPGVIPGSILDQPAIDAAFFIAASVVVAGMVQLAMQVSAMRSMKRDAPLITNIRGTKAPLMSMFKAMIPMTLGLAVFQINTLVDALIAFGLAKPTGGAPTLHLLSRQTIYPIEAGAVGALQYAQRLYQFPLGVFSIALATAIFPALTRVAAAGNNSAFRQTLAKGLRLCVFIGLPATVGLLFVRQPLTQVIFQRGAFSADDVSRVATILIGYGVGVWAYSMTHVLMRAFYALDDQQTPLRASLGSMGLNLAMNLGLIWPLGAAGLAWSTAISAAVLVVMLMRLLRRRIGIVVDDAVRMSWIRSAAMTAIMVGALVPTSILLQGLDGGSMSAIVRLCVLVIVGAAVYLTAARQLGAAELRWLISRGTGDTPAADDNE